MTHGRAFRFLHASDLLLDRPLAGPLGVPPTLRRRLAEAHYRSASAVFTAAIQERVDFVVLSGGLLNLAQAAPSEVSFLIEEFHRLHQHGIPVYWAGSVHDGPANLAAHHRLPANVTHLATSQAEVPPGSGLVPPAGSSARAPLHTVLVQKDGQTIARIAGLSRQSHQSLNDLSFHLPRHPAPFTIGLLHVRFDERVDHLGDLAGFDYWALGGRMTADESPRGSSLAPVRYAGTPIGRTLEHVTQHGCTLVEVDQHGVRPRTLATATVAWHLESVEVNLGDTLEMIEKRVQNRCRQLLAPPAAAIDRIVTWRLHGPHAVLHRARVQGWDVQLTERLQQLHGMQSPALWSRAVELQPAVSVSPEDYPADSLTAEFLRTAREVQTKGTEKLNLQPFADEAAASLPANVTHLDRTRETVPLLAEAALLGAEYLHGKEVC